MSKLNTNEIPAIANQKAFGLLCYENERPLRGLIGALDWKYNGVFTRLLRAGTITGQENEFSYVPLKWNEETFHFLILGAGENVLPGKRNKVPDQQRKIFKDKATALGLNGVLIEGEESDGS